MLRPLALCSVINVAVLATLISSAHAQTVVLDNMYDCQRATNGRAYCKLIGAPPDSQYRSVTEEFFARYEIARTGRANVVTVQQNNTQVNQTQINNSVVIQLRADASDLKGQIELLSVVLSGQRALAARGGDVGALHQEAIEAIEERLSEIRAEYSKKVRSLAQTYSTPVRPDDADLGITARRASEIYPKVPYYIPGTREQGEFWIEPTVSDNGVLIFRFKFVDTKSTAAEKVRGSIEMRPDELERAQKALLKIGSNSRTAHEKKIRRKIEVRVDCFPAADCPPEGQKVDGKASTEMIFAINEDGSTSGRIQRNKGRFEEGYNFSVKSGLLLQAYIHHVLTEGKAEFEAGTASPEELKNLFR